VTKMFFGRTRQAVYAVEFVSGVSCDMVQRLATYRSPVWLKTLCGHMRR
jgi:hypothetical protein